MKYVINDQVVLLQAPEGPLATHIVSFAAFVKGQGYAKSSTHQQVRLVADFSRWLTKKGTELQSIVSDHPRQYLHYRAQQIKPCRSDSATLRHLIYFLRSKDIIPPEEIFIPQLTPAEYCAQGYEQYLIELRNLAKATLLNYLPFIHCFLKDCFGDGPVEFLRLYTRDVVKFVQRQAPLLHGKRVKLMTCALRSFLIYLRYRGEVVLDLAAAVPVVANWSMPSIPRAISPKHVEQLLASIDQRTVSLITLMEPPMFALMEPLDRYYLALKQVEILTLFHSFSTVFSLLAASETVQFFR